MRFIGRFAGSSEERNRPVPQANKRQFRGELEIGNPASLAGYVGAAKAAEFLDLSPSTLRDYSDRGIIPCYRIGKHRKYSLEKIREKLEKEQRESGPGRFEALRGHLR